MKSLAHSVYRIILLIAGALHIVVFFVLPFLTPGTLLSLFGASTSEIPSFTGFNMVRMINGFLAGAWGYVLIAITILTVVLGVIIALVSLMFEGKGCYTASLIMSIAQFVCYGLVYIFTLIVNSFAFALYNVCIWTIIIIAILCILQIVMSIVGLVKERRPKELGYPPNGTLTGLSGTYYNARIPVRGGNRVLIGRDPQAGCNVIIKGEKVSRAHCTIEYNPMDGMYIVTDYSTNGTFDSDGQRLPKEEPVPRLPGCVIRIGEHGDEFRLG